VTIAGRDLDWVATGLVIVASGCGGGVPLLIPAHAMPLGEVRATTGLSANVGMGPFARSLNDARNASSNPDGSAAEANATDARATLVTAAIGPGIAPVVSARVGLGANSEAGASFLGRAVRADVRHSVRLAAHWDLSAGVGGSAVVGGHESADSDVDLGRLRGGGADVPVMVGYESDGGLYAAWLGLRAGWEQVGADDVRSEVSESRYPGPPVSLSARRLWAGGLFGFAVGFRHVHVAMELDVAYANISGDLSSTHIDLAGLTVCPASAVWWRF